MSHLSDQMEVPDFDAFMKADAKVRESHKSLFRNGVVKGGTRRPLFIYVIGALYFHRRPPDCTSDAIYFPGYYYTVHISHDPHGEPTILKTKYFCGSYESASALAEKMREDKGIDVVDLVKRSDSRLQGGSAPD